MSDNQTQVLEEFGKSIQNKKYKPEELNEGFSVDSKDHIHMERKKYKILNVSFQNVIKWS